MGLIRIVLELLALYVLYKVVFDFIIPMYQTTKQVSKKMGEMQTKMNDHFNKQQQQANSTAEKTAKPAKEDYIEFEDMK